MNPEDMRVGGHYALTVERDPALKPVEYDRIEYQGKGEAWFADNPDWVEWHVFKTSDPEHPYVLVPPDRLLEIDAYGQHMDEWTGRAEISHPPTGQTWSGDVEIRDYGDPEGLCNWDGNLLDEPTWLATGPGPYPITLADGRSGEVLVNLTELQGTEPLE